MPKLREILRNEYVKSLLFLVIVIASIAVFWLGLRAFLQTEYPLLAVASGSMEPTLSTGDLIVVQGGLTVSEIVAEYGTGDIIVFYRPGSPGELIVHRAVESHGSGDNTFLRTKGDANPSLDGWQITDSQLVGKVVSAIPYVGNIPLFVHTRNGMLIVIGLIAVLIVLEFIIPSAKERKKTEPTELKTEPELRRSSDDEATSQEI